MNTPSKLKDPVCALDVTPRNVAGKTEYQGNTYYFCSLGCQQTFESQPEKYAAPLQPAHAHACC